MSEVPLYGGLESGQPVWCIQKVMSCRRATSCNPRESTGESGMKSSMNPTPLCPVRHPTSPLHPVHPPSSSTTPDHPAPPLRRCQHRPHRRLAASGSCRGLARGGCIQPSDIHVAGEGVERMVAMRKLSRSIPSCAALSGAMRAGGLRGEG